MTPPFHVRGQSYPVRRLDPPSHSQDPPGTDQLIEDRAAMERGLGLVVATDAWHPPINTTSVRPVRRIRQNTVPGSIVAAPSALAAVPNQSRCHVIAPTLVAMARFTRSKRTWNRIRMANPLGR